MLLRGVLALAASLDLTPAVAPTPVGCSDATVTVLPVILRGVLALAASLDLPPAVAPTPVGCSDASVAVLPVPLC